MAWTHVFPTLASAIESAQNESPKWKAYWPDNGHPISRARTVKGYVRGDVWSVVARVLRDGTVRYGK